MNSERALAPEYHPLRTDCGGSVNPGSRFWVAWSSAYLMSFIWMTYWGQSWSMLLCWADWWPVRLVCCLPGFVATRKYYYDKVYWFSFLLLFIFKKMDFIVLKLNKHLCLIVSPLLCFNKTYEGGASKNMTLHEEEEDSSAVGLHNRASLDDSECSKYSTILIYSWIFLTNTIHICVCCPIFYK